MHSTLTDQLLVTLVVSSDLIEQYCYSQFQPCKKLRHTSRSNTSSFVSPKVKQVSENPLAKQPVQKRRAGEWEQMETRILEISINKICRYETTEPCVASIPDLQ